MSELGKERKEMGTTLRVRLAGERGKVERQERGRRSPGSPGVGVQSCPILLSSFSDHPVDSRGYYTGASDTPYLHVSCWLVARASRTV